MFDNVYNTKDTDVEDFFFNHKDYSNTFFTCFYNSPTKIHRQFFLKVREITEKVGKCLIKRKTLLVYV